jgi:hypothetical protein
MAPTQKFCARCNRKHAAPTGKCKCRLPIADFLDTNTFEIEMYKGHIKAKKPVKNSLKIFFFRTINARGKQKQFHNLYEVLSQVCLRQLPVKITGIENNNFNAK